MTFTFDKASIANEPAPAKGNVIKYDRGTKDSVTGLGIRVTAAGARAFILNYRIGKRERRITIGSFPDWSVKAARDEAARLKREQIDRGIDPLAERIERRDGKTVGDLCDRFISDYLPKKRPITQRDYKALIEKRIRPALKHELVAELRHDQVDDMFRKITKEAPYIANRTVAVLSKMMSEAMRWQWRTGDNPVKGIERNQETKRKRYLKRAESDRLTAALNKFPVVTKVDGTTTIDAGNLQSANIIRLLMLTGARRKEALSAKWEQFVMDEDGETMWWHKPGATTKQKTDHHIPLSEQARELIEGIKRTESDYLFPGLGGKGHQLDVKKAWAAICEAAQITGLRLHDLRHNYASVLISEGESLPMVGELLGHTQAQTTARYAHLMSDALKNAAKKAGAALTAKPKLRIVK